MSGETENSVSAWTIDSLKEHLHTITLWEERFYHERDRRYAEVALEREKALQIKEAADRRALELASEIQKYKDEKANNLRAQIEGERGIYVTKVGLEAAIEKIEVQLKPVSDFVTSQTTRHAVTTDSQTSRRQGQALLVSVLGVMVLGFSTIITLVLAAR